MQRMTLHQTPDTTAPLTTADAPAVQPAGPSLWKWGLLALLMVSALFDIWALSNWRRALDPATAGTLGVTLGRADAQNRRPVLALNEVSPLLREGVQVGDLLRLARYNDDEGARPLGVDERITLTLYQAAATGVAVERAERVLTVQPVASPWFRADRAWVSWTSGWLMRLAALTLALLIVLRQPHSPAMRALTLALLTENVFGLYFLPGGALPELVASFGPPLASWIGAAAFLYFSLNFPQPLQTSGRGLMRGFWALTVPMLLLALAFAVDRQYLGPDAFRVPLRTLLREWSVGPWLYWAGNACNLLSLLALVWHWRRSEGLARQRLGWVGLSIGLRYAVFLMLSVLAQTSAWPSVAPWQYLVIDLSGFVCYLSLSYAVLRHRIFNFSVVVQRALAFSIVSTLLLMAFGIGKWGVEKFLRMAGQEHSFVFDAGVAMLVVVVFARAQQWVVGHVNRIFFRRWHDAALALRQFVDQAAQYTEPAALQQRFVEAVDQFSGAPGCALYIADADGALQRVAAGWAPAPMHFDTNHALCVALRHQRAQLDLRLLPTGPSNTVPGEFAFPMLVRGRVSGALLLAGRNDGSAYRPEELEQLASSVRHIGLDLESLRVEELERQNRELLAAQAVNTLALSNAELRLGLAAAGQSVAQPAGQ
jgi:hypothetical protein